MSKFRDRQGRLITNGLFEETAVNKEYVQYSLEELRSEYIEMRDPTGYKFSQEFLENYQHWKALKDSVALAPIIADWEEELEVAIRCQEIERIGEIAKTGHFQASKFLTDRGWEKRKPGKPSKEEVQRETRVQSKMADAFSADIKRIKRD